MGLVLALLLLFPKVPLEIQPLYQKAVLSWSPYRAPVAEVKFCTPFEDCPELINVWGFCGLWVDKTLTIYIDRTTEWPTDGLLVTLMHEYGHALGLSHTLRPGSIMVPGWTEPIAPRPDSVDLQSARNPMR